MRPCSIGISSGWRDAGAERAEADHEADADAGVGLDQGDEFVHG
jgi:hypothetical protein